jgi:hypothetical protein
MTTLNQTRDTDKLYLAVRALHNDVPLCDLDEEKTEDSIYSRRWV